MGWGKLNWKCKASNDFFFQVSKSLTACSVCEQKVFKSCVAFLKVCMKRRELLNINELFEVLLFEQNINNIRDHFEF